MARGLAVLFAAGAALVAATLLMPHDAGTNDPGEWVAVVAAVGIAGALAAGRSRVRVGMLHAAVVCGSCLIAWCVLFGGPAASAYPLMFLWVAIYSAYFFSRRAALAHALFAAAAYAAALWGTGDVAAPAVHWVMAFGTAVVGGLLIGRLTEAVREQAADLAAVARLATRLGCVAELAQETCESLMTSARADVAVLLEAAPDGDGLQVTAMAGMGEVARVFSAPGPLRTLQAAFQAGRSLPLSTSPGGRGPFIGLAEPVVLEGRTAGVLAVAWRRPRRGIADRVGQAARLHAGRASELLARAERRAGQQKRRALEINDNIVQGLVVAKYAAQAEQTEESIRAIDETLVAARRLITDALDGEIAPGDLVRAQAY